MSNLNDAQYLELGKFLAYHLKNGATISGRKGQLCVTPLGDNEINCALDIVYPDDKDIKFNSITPEPHE